MQNNDVDKLQENSHQTMGFFDHKKPGRILTPKGKEFLESIK